MQAFHLLLPALVTRRSPLVLETSVSCRLPLAGQGSVAPRHRSSSAVIGTQDIWVSGVGGITVGSRSVRQWVALLLKSGIKERVTNDGVWLTFFLLFNLVPWSSMGLVPLTFKMVSCEEMQHIQLLTPEREPTADQNSELGEF